jgi:hypothetical protein
MKRHLFHLAAALMVALATLVGYGFWYATIADESAVVANLQNQIIAKTETMSRIVSVRAKLAKIAEDKTTVQSYFVLETDVVAFIDGLEEQGKAQRTAVNVLSVSAGSEDTQPIFVLSLAIKGTFDAVMRTVGAIEYAPYDLSISELSLIQDDAKNWQADLKLLVGSVKIGTSTPNTL